MVRIFFSLFLYVNLYSQRIRVYSKIIDEYAPVAFPVKVNTDMLNVRAASNPLLTNIASTPLLLTDQESTHFTTSITSSTSTSTTTISSNKSSAAGGITGVAGLAKGLTESNRDLSLNPVTSVVKEISSVIAHTQNPTGIDEASIAAYKQIEEMTERAQQSSRAISSRRAINKIPTPQWHAPWKLMRVIAGHQGWVRCITVDPTNEWFATGSADRTIKIWDLASGTLKLTLTGHIGGVRGLAISPRHPYLFSVGEDKQVKCWDLESNTVIGKYIGHLSGVYSIALHPTLDVFMTGGRDSVCRVWDIRTKTNIHTLTGHENTITSIISNSVDPQIITGSIDTTIRFWDLVAGKVRSVLTHHKHAVRSLVAHPKEFAFISGSSDHLKKWSLPEGTFVQNLDGHNSLINSLAVNEDNVLVSGGDDGSLKFWDYTTGYSFQYEQTRVQPGSLDSEAGIYASCFDQTGMRLITGEADKTIKIWREDTDATPETHPIDMEGWTAFCKAHKTY